MFIEQCHMSQPPWFSTQSTTFNHQHGNTHTHTHVRTQAGAGCRLPRKKLQICGWSEETRSKICMSSFSRCALNINVAAATTVVAHGPCRVAMSRRSVSHCAHTHARTRACSSGRPCGSSPSFGPFWLLAGRFSSVKAAV